jgi:ribosomal protein S18 acetylase RimI-like enzyme
VSSIPSHVRSATSGDAARIAALHIASWRAVYQKELPGDFLNQLDHAQRAQEWRQRLESGRVQVILAEQEWDLLGFCAHGWSEDGAAGGTWEIMNLHVAPDLRGGGVGSKLFDRALASAAEHGAHHLSLWVAVTNDAARRFYEKKGLFADPAATKSHELGPGVLLEEIRYFVALKST